MTLIREVLFLCCVWDDKLIAEQGRDHCLINNVEVAWRQQPPQSFEAYARLGL